MRVSTIISNFWAENEHLTQDSIFSSTLIEKIGTKITRLRAHCTVNTALLLLQFLLNVLNPSSIARIQTEQTLTQKLMKFESSLSAIQKKMLKPRPSRINIRWMNLWKLYFLSIKLCRILSYSVSLVILSELGFSLEIMSWSSESLLSMFLSVSFFLGGSSWSTTGWSFLVWL